MTNPTTTEQPASTAPCTRGVHRIEVRHLPGQPDPLADAVWAQAKRSLDGLASLHTAQVFLIEAALTDAQLRTVANELLADPVTQQTVIGTEQPTDHTTVVEVHLQPGVMDPVAESTQDAIAELLGPLAGEPIAVRTGVRYDLQRAPGTGLPPQQVHRFAEAVLANPVIQEIHHSPYHPHQFAHGRAYELKVVHVPIRGLDDAALEALSRDGHLFLNLEEMKAIQRHYQSIAREPTDLELETLAQTWSEHCVHKTLKATIRYSQSDAPEAAPSPKQWALRPGHELQADGSVTIQNLLKSTIAAATNKLMEQAPFNDWCVSVFEDNAGIVRFDDDDALCIKVETHNHPSAIEPYGGAATGIGGCIRDVMGTGLAARPIANTDVFCVAPPDQKDGTLPPGVIHPRRVLQRVVEGVRDYGNRMGIPTVNGAVWFDADYLGNPLVFAGCVGLLPLDRCFGKPRPGDRIIVLGGHTGRDGIHGATFSSAELTDTHADQFSHAVQIGNAITQKKTLDVILQARDHRDGALFTAITDCGAGGLSSAVGEMGQQLGAAVTLDTAPLKYQGLSYTEIWISEAQERMVLAVPPEHTDTLRRLCADEDVPFCDLGCFGASDHDEPALVLTYHGTEVGRLSMRFLHDGLPTPTRNARWSGGASTAGSPTTRAAKPAATGPATLTATLNKLLAHPNIASKHWIVRQYDHEVQGTSVIKPLVGPDQVGPGDAAVLRPKLRSAKGVAISCGLATGLGEKTAGGDAYWMALAAIDEAVRNCVCVGGDPTRVAILDNFCWPNCDNEEQLGRLVRAAQGCHDGALAYRTPFVSGKDSLSNQFTTADGRLITIAPTLLITAMAMVNDINRTVTMNAKAPGNHLLLVGSTGPQLGGSHFHRVGGAGSADGAIPRVDLEGGPKNARTVAQLIAEGRIQSAHDCSDGGLLVAAAEMAFSGRVGLDLFLNDLAATEPLDPVTACFSETPSRYLLEAAPPHLGAIEKKLSAGGVVWCRIGRWCDHQRLTVRRSPADEPLLDQPLEKLRKTWLAPLDW